VCVFRRGAKGPRVATSRHRRPQHVCFYNFSFFFLHQFHARESDWRKSLSEPRKHISSSPLRNPKLLLLATRVGPATTGYNLCWCLDYSPCWARSASCPSSREVFQGARESSHIYTQTAHTHTHPVVYSWYIYSIYLYPPQTMHFDCIRSEIYSQEPRFKEL
jgi:hypothetical protein